MGKQEPIASIRSAILVDHVPEIEARGDLIHFTHLDGSGAHFVMPVATCRRMQREITEALAAYDTRPSAKIIKLKKRKRRH